MTYKDNQQQQILLKSISRGAQHLVQYFSLGSRDRYHGSCLSRSSVGRGHAPAVGQRLTRVSLTVHSKVNIRGKGLQN